MTKARQRFYAATCPIWAPLPEWGCPWVEVGHRSPESAFEASRRHVDAAHPVAPPTRSCLASCIDQGLTR